MASRVVPPERRARIACDARLAPPSKGSRARSSSTCRVGRRSPSRVREAEVLAALALAERAWGSAAACGSLVHLMHMHPRLLPSGLVLMLSIAVAGCSDLGVKVRLQAHGEVSSASLDFGTPALTEFTSRTVTARNTRKATLAGDATGSF